MALRIFGIPATRAPVVAVLTRGPTEWAHVGRWDLERGTFESGAWLHGVLYPQRCDLSPDGRWLAYFTHHPSAQWELGWTYEAISRLPWLTALAAWATDGTWSHGIEFTEDADRWEPSDPDHGDVAPLRGRFGLLHRRVYAFPVERGRGWAETADSPPRDQEHDFWDERRAERLVMEKARPTDPEVRLTVRGFYAAFRTALPGRPHDADYVVDWGEESHALERVQWADWDERGRLLAATTEDRLRILDGPPDAMRVIEEVDLGWLSPDPKPAPPEASSW